MTARRAMWLALALAATIRVAVAPLRALSFDEAHYLCAARSTARIADHPPMLLWLLRLGDHAPFGVELRVRLIAIACQAITALGVARLAHRLGGERAATFAAVLATWGLMPWAGGLIATPDAPLLAASAWLFALAADEKPRLVPLAMVSAVALASKVSAGLVIAAIALALPARGAAALMVGAAVAAPLAFQSAMLQAQHAMGRGPLVSAPKVGAIAAVTGFVLGAFVLWSPAVWVLAFAARSSMRQIPGAITLVVATLALVLLSALVSGRPPEPNWIAPAMLPLFAVAGVALSERSRDRPRIIGAHAVVHVVPALVGIALWIAPSVLPPAIDPLARAPHDVGRLPDAPRPAYAAAAWSCVYR